MFNYLKVLHLDDLTVLIFLGVEEKHCLGFNLKVYLAHYT